MTADHPGYDGDAYDDDYFDDDVMLDDDVEDDDRRGRSRRRWRRRIVLALAVLVLVAIAGAALWVQRQIDPPGPPGDTVAVDIPEGASTAEIGRHLADAGVIANATVWNWYTRVRNVGVIVAGEYELRKNSSFSQAIAALGEGPALPAGRFVTIPEGFTLQQAVARIVDAEEGIEGFTAERIDEVLAGDGARSRFLPDDRQSREGTLFPETYRVEQDEDEAALLNRMVAQFDAVMEELNAEALAAELGVSPYQALIVASLVENETRVAEERPRVARVIYNRLEAGEPLGIDATSCYEKNESPCELTDADLDSDSPYNTRRKPGLPPTPISSPGRASLDAALNPAEGNWRWYVLNDEDGSHAFTDSFEEFQVLVQECADRGLGCG